MDTLTLVNGNGQRMTKELPRLFIHGYINEVALEHITDNTGLYFNKVAGGLEAQTTSSQQIVKLFLTYNFKTRYFDNSDVKNTIYLKTDHHIGFEVDSICAECAKENHLRIGDLKPGDRLSC